MPILCPPFSWLLRWKNHNSPRSLVLHPLAVFAVLSFTACQTNTGGRVDGARMVQIDAEATGIHFANRIDENDTFNILALEYVYNGGGVGVGDFNADGLPDLYFTGNTAANALYINRGDFHFEDVTAIAGVAASERWSSGVAIADVNGDGLDDIYVCATVLQPNRRRANLLFINEGPNAQGVPSFRESAIAYGLADTSHTTAAAWLDYDRDGDLDLYVLVNHMDDKRFPNRYGPRQLDGKSTRNDKLYRNNGPGPDGQPTFTNVSDLAGIAEDGYGLGVAVCDLNADGWPDLYVANDYLSPDLAWINQRDGTFRNELLALTSHTSYSAMGIDVVDLNGDSRPEIITLDMLPGTNRRRKTMVPAGNFITHLNNDKYGYPYQYMRNALQLNRGPLQAGDELPIFSEIGMMSGIAATDWSWSVLAADIDLDANRDLLITNGFPRDVTDLDFMDYSSELGQYSSPEFLLDKIPSVKISNRAFAGEGGAVPHYRDATAEWGLELPSFSNGAATVDLDGDGDLDYVVNRINDSALVYRNDTRQLPTLKPSENGGKSTATIQPHYLAIRLAGAAPNVHALGAAITLYCGGKTQSAYQSPYRGYLSTVSTDLHFGLDSLAWVDSLTVDWPTGLRTVLTKVAADQLLVIDERSGMPGPYAAGQPRTMQQFPGAAAPFMRDITVEAGLGDVAFKEELFVDFNVQRLLLRQLSQAGPALAVGDIDGDGLDDLLLGGAFGQPDQILYQTKGGGFSAPRILYGPDATASAKTLGETVAAVIFDADGDGRQDVYIAHGSIEASPGDQTYRDRLLRNTPNGLRLDTTALPALAVSSSCVQAGDVDGDGDVDLFVGARSVPGRFPLAERSTLLLNDGRGKFTAAAYPWLSVLGMVTDAQLADFNGDGHLDLVVVEDFGPLRLLLGGKQGFAEAKWQALGDSPAERPGCWSSLFATDLDGDGDLDLVAGNLGRNHLYSAGGEDFLRIYAGDFDGNGDVDVLPAARFLDDAGKLAVFPYFQRQEMEKQLPIFKRLFPAHRELADINSDQLMERLGKVADATVEATYLPSITLINDGQGHFTAAELPAEAQLAPLRGMTAIDLNADGHMDLLLSGNEYGMEARMGRFDALHGLVLLGNSRGQWLPVNYDEAGFAVRGDARTIVQVARPGREPLVVVGVNGGGLKAFVGRQAANKDL